MAPTLLILTCVGSNGRKAGVKSSVVVVLQQPVWIEHGVVVAVSLRCPRCSILAVRGAMRWTAVLVKTKRGLLQNGSAHPWPQSC